MRRVKRKSRKVLVGGLAPRPRDNIDMIRDLIRDGVGAEEIREELHNEGFEDTEIQDMFRVVYGSPTGVSLAETRRQVRTLMERTVNPVPEAVIRNTFDGSGWDDDEIEEIFRGATGSEYNGGRKSRTRRRLQNKKRKSKRTRNK